MRSKNIRSQVFREYSPKRNQKNLKFDHVRAQARGSTYYLDDLWNFLDICHGPSQLLFLIHHTIEINDQ